MKTEHRAVLLSIRPRFAQSLIGGTKTAEVRRRFPDLPVGTRVYVYSSSPDKSVIGTFQVSGIYRCLNESVWSQFRHRIDISEADLKAYLRGALEAVIIEAENPEGWEVPLPLYEFRRLLGIEPPQSFRYLTPKQSTALDALR